VTKKVLAVGCSFTKGTGLPGEHENPRLWVNQLFSGSDITIAAKTGANNHWIFLEAMTALTSQDYDTVIVGWSAIPRYNFQMGLELYSVDTMLHDMDVHVNNGMTFQGKWLEQIGNNLRKIHNDHWDILTLVKYVNSLILIQEKYKQGKIYFVNSLAPWDRGYFQKKDFSVPSQLTKYVQDVLSVNTRDDQEIQLLYSMIHDHYESYGGIREEKWLNLYDSLISLKIDDASSTDGHPGLLSQDLYAELLKKCLNKLQH
jgi:hypothetical protein